MTDQQSTNAEPEALGEFNGHEIYPMPAFAALAVEDVAAVAAWYERTLGFATVFRAPEVDGQPGLVHLRRMKYQDLLLTPARSGHAVPGESSVTLTFSADGEVDALAERARAAAPLGRSAIDGPVNTPWNTRDLRVIDPEGHRLVFTGRNPHASAEQLARMKAMLDRSRER